MNFYQFHIGDYIKQTVHLTPMEDICYRRLIDMYYETEQPIPTETDRVSRRLRLDTELVDSVLKEFFTLTENGWENARCNKEIDTYHIKADTARSNGKLGGRPKKTQPVPDRNQSESGSKANQEPITNNQEPITKKEEKEEKKTTRQGSSNIDLLPNVEKQVAEDFLRLRKEKKLPVTKTAMEAIAREAEKAGIDFPSAIKFCCECGWGGFNARWYADRNTSQTHGRAQSPDNRPLVKLFPSRGAR